MGNNTPQVRFKGFTDAWVQGKLSNILTVNSGRDYKHLHRGDIPVYGTGGYMLNVDESLSDEDAIGIGRKGTIDKPQLLKAPFWTVDTLFFMTPKPNNELFYLYALSQGIEWAKLDESTGVPSLSKTNIENIVKHTPNHTEQTAIGNFFRTLDTIITANQQKLSKLKQLKAAYLQQMFSQAGENVPRIRFDGFSGEWEERRLGELVGTTFGGGTPSTTNDSYWNGNIPWLQSSDIVEHNVSSVNLRKYITTNGLENSSTKLVPANSIAVVTRVGVGKLSVIPFEFATSQDFLSLANMNVDIWCVVYSLYKKMQSELSVVQGTSIKGITKEELLNKTISIPSINMEQTTIGNFFRNLDIQITTQANKTEQLKQLKTAYLQKMFV